METYSPSQFNKLFFLGEKSAHRLFFSKWDFNNYKMEFGHFPSQIAELELIKGEHPVSASGYNYALGYRVRIYSKTSGRKIHEDFFSFGDIFAELKSNHNIHVSYPKWEPKYMEGGNGFSWNVMTNEENIDALNDAVNSFCERIVKKLMNWSPK